ncbi:MAG: hypothetical protein ACLR1T_02225 [Evtepia gabavorous]
MAGDPCGTAYQRETPVREWERSSTGFLTATGGEPGVYPGRALGRPSETGEKCPCTGWPIWRSRSAGGERAALAGMAQGKTPPQGEMETEREAAGRAAADDEEEWSQRQQ